MDLGVANRLQKGVDFGSASACTALATDAEFIARFPECEIGAMPPFDNFFGMKVYVDPALGKDE